MDAERKKSGPQIPARLAVNLRQAWFWLLVTLLGMGAFPWCPMGLRWPLRILVVIAIACSLWFGIRQVVFGSAANRCRRIVTTAVWFLLAASLVWLLRPAWQLQVWKNEGKPIPTASCSVERIDELRQELDRRGINLVVLGLPSFNNVFPNTRGKHEIPAKLENFHAREALALMSASGIPTMDMMPLLQTHALDKSDWLKDRVHLQKQKYRENASPLISELSLREIGPTPDDDRKVVLMGNCFASLLTSAIGKMDSDWQNVRALTALGDRGRVADSLFLFPEEYLEGTGHVIWLMTYELLAAPELPRLNADPNIEDATMRNALIHVTASLGWNKALEKTRVPSLPYPDALVTISGTVAEGSDIPAGTEILAVGYGMENRQILALGRLKPSRRIRAHLVPFDAWVAKNPKVASAHILNDAGPLDAERYWIQSWTQIR